MLHLQEYRSSFIVSCLSGKQASVMLCHSSLNQSRTVKCDNDKFFFSFLFHFLFVRVKIKLYLAPSDFFVRHICQNHSSLKIYGPIMGKAAERICVYIPGWPTVYIHEISSLLNTPQILQHSYNSKRLYHKRDHFAFLFRQHLIISR